MSAAAGGLILDQVEFQTVASNVPNVVAVRHAGDGSQRLFLILQNGRIRILDASGALVSTPFLNIGSGGTPPPLNFSNGGERGLLGLAFHPLYASNRLFYVYYTDGNGNTVVAEYKASAANPNIADATSGRVILRVYQPYANHNGGDIHFGADGYLYIGLGDGGSGGDPCNAGQSLTSAAMPNSPSACVANAAFTATPPAGVPTGNANSRALLGKMLRIDVDSTHTPDGADLCGADPALRTYGIPNDNPFAGNAGGNAAACDETYHYGLRNPWRFGFDRETHDLIIGDVGQGTWEELNLVPGAASGLNFGWKICEGFHETGSTTTPCSLAGRTDPILAYGRSVGYSIAGGYRYRGPHTALNHVIFSGDYIGKIFAITQDGSGDWSIEKTWSSGVGSIVGFGEGEDGHLYSADLDGTVKRISLPLQAGATPELELVIHATLIDDNSNAFADVGETVQLDYSVSNSGDLALTWVMVQDSLGNAFQCTPLLHVAASTPCGQATHVITSKDLGSGELVITAEATATLPDGSTLTTPAQDEVRFPTVGIFADDFESP